MRRDDNDNTISVFMFFVSRFLKQSVRFGNRVFFSTRSFEAITKEHSVLVENLQKIAEADRKFVSFEVGNMSKRI